MPQFILMTIPYIVALILTFSSYIIKINGQTSFEISNRFPVIFAPLNVSYVIWIVIFILLGYWLVMNFKKQRLQERLSLKRGILFSSVMYTAIIDDYFLAFRTFCRLINRHVHVSTLLIYAV